MPNEFALDITRIRDDARAQMEQGAVTQDNTSDVKAVIDVLNQVETEPTDLTRMLEENLVAERIVISSYQEIIRWLGDSDPITRRLMESILEEEEEHADDLNDLRGN